MENEEKIYFNPGDVVVLKQDIPNKPTMLVSNINRAMYKVGNAQVGQLKGIECIWFTADGYLQERIFSTKDLVHVNN